jgi:hypothetical protein
MDVFLSIADAATVSGYSQQTLYRFIRDKRVPAYQLPGSRGGLRVRLSDIMQPATSVPGSPRPHLQKPRPKRIITTVQVDLVNANNSDH